MFKIPTKAEADILVEENDAFYCMEHEIDGYKIHVYNYRLASPADFRDNPGSEELRGLCFVQDRGERWVDGQWKRNHCHRFAMLHKFFNLNQAEGYMESDIADKTVRKIWDKEDGSMIRFIKIPNGRVIAKTKMGFTNDQAIAAQRIYDTDKKIKKFVDYTLSNGMAAIFEYVSSSNRIVLQYRVEQLILLQVRDEAEGYYYDIEQVICDSRSIVAYVRSYDPVSISALSEAAVALEPKYGLTQALTEHEGWVIQFTDGQMIKIKTQWYCERHRLITEDISKENFIIQKILDEEIDDILGQLAEDDPLRFYVEYLVVEVSKYYNELYVMLLDTMPAGIDPDDKVARKELAMKYRKWEFFGMLMDMFKKDTDSIVKEYIKRETGHLEQAKRWLIEKGMTDVKKF
jgi:T4 RnlA family RNA ligase